MKTITRILVAVSALAVATPLAAQPPYGDDVASRPGHHIRQTSTDLRAQLDSGIARGTITPREATMLRVDLNALVHLARIYGRDGFSRTERATLVRRGRGLQRLIRRAEENGIRGVPRGG